MRVAFSAFDGREKRWFPKVAKAAADRLNAVVADFSCQLVGIWSAEFATHLNSATTIRHLRTDDLVATTVVFAAADWKDLISATPDASDQLASALLRVVPREVAVELRDLFVSAGVQPSRQVKVLRQTAAVDPRFHADIQITSPGFDSSKFSCQYDELDLALQSAGFGEVDGSSVGLDGYSLEVALKERDAGLRMVFEFLKQWDVESFACVIDASTGEQLTR